MVEKSYARVEVPGHGTVNGSGEFNSTAETQRRGERELLISGFLGVSASLR